MHDREGTPGQGAGMELSNVFRIVFRFVLFSVVLGVVWVVLGVVLEQVEAVAKPLLVPVLKKPPPGPPKPPPGPPKTPPGPIYDFNRKISRYHKGKIRKFHVKQANPRNNTFYDFSRKITHFMISTYFLLKSYIGPGGVFGGPGGGLGGPGGGFRTRKNRKIPR